MNPRQAAFDAASATLADAQAQVNSIGTLTTCYATTFKNLYDAEVINSTDVDIFQPASDAAKLALDNADDARYAIAALTANVATTQATL